MSRRRGWRWNNNGAVASANVSGVMEFYAEDNEPADSVTNPVYVFDENGRISTSSHNGAAITVPDDYTLGEMLELQYSFAETGNSQRQGLFLHVDAAAANSSTIRAAEFTAKRAADVAVGTLEGVNAAGYIRVDGSAAVTNAFGVTGELQTEDGYTGTVTKAAAVRGKFQFEDGATYTKSFAVLAQQEAVTGAGFITAYFGAECSPEAANNGAKAIIDARDGRLEEVSGNKVRLIAFTDDLGTERMLVFDSDSNTVTSVETYA